MSRALTDSNNYNQLPNNSLNNQDKDEYDFKQIIAILRKRKFLIASITTLVVFMAVIFLYLKTPKYTSSLSLLINVNTSNVVDIESVVTGISGDDPAIQSELDIIRSRKLLSKVANKLELDKYAEFNPLKSEPSILDRSLKYISELVFPTQNIVSVSDKERITKATVIDNISKNLSVRRSPKSYTIRISFTSIDSDLAALIVNTLAEEYTLNQLNAKFEASKKANDWLNVKLLDLQKKVRESDLAVEEFRKENNLIESDGKALNEQQLSELNSQLILAKTERAQAESRLRIAKNTIDASSEVLDSRLIQSLRSQEAEVLRKRSDLENRYGGKHPKMLNVTRELRDLRTKINEEISKVRNSLKNEVSIARTRERSLEKSLKSLTKDTSISNVARVQLDELVRDLNANKSLYESFLLRFKEINQNQDLEQADAQVISEAEPPFKPSSPNKKLVLVFSVILGLFCGVGLSFLIEVLDNTFTTSTQLERITNTKSIGIVPEIKKKHNFRDLLDQKKASNYSESIRSILTAIRFASSNKELKSLMVTSSTNSEGKSSLVISLATLMSKSGMKVLIVDCDFRRPSINNKLNVKTDKGIVEVITGDYKENDVIEKDEKGGFYFIGCAKPNIINSQDILNSNEMKEFTTRVAKNYDIIIYDTPPIMAVSDALTVSKYVDSCVFMVRSEKTTNHFVNASLKQIRFCNIDLVGTVLTRVKLHKTRQYSYGNEYYYGQYTSYET